MFTDFSIKTSIFATALQPEFIINLINVTIMKKILLTLLLMMAAMINPAPIARMTMITELSIVFICSRLPT